MANEKLKKVGIFATGFVAGRWSVPDQAEKDLNAARGALHVFAERARLRQEIIRTDRSTGPIWRRAFYSAYYVFFRPKMPPGV